MTGCTSLMFLFSRCMAHVNITADVSLSTMQPFSYHTLVSMISLKRTLHSLIWPRGRLKPGVAIHGPPCVLWPVVGGV
jgi:hypothetical protein